MLSRSREIGGTRHDRRARILRQCWTWLILMRVGFVLPIRSHSQKRPAASSDRYSASTTVPSATQSDPRTAQLCPSTLSFLTQSSVLSPQSYLNTHVSLL